MNDPQRSENPVPVRRGRFLLLAALAAVGGAVVTADHMANTALAQLGMGFH